MIEVLPSFNNYINYHKIFYLIKAKEADVKAEAIEVLKGVIGPSRTETLLNLIVTNDESRNAVDIDWVFNKLGDNSCSSIVIELLGAIHEEDFLKRRDFVMKCFKNDEDAIRLRALEVFLKFESDDVQIKETCEKFKTDSCQQIIQLIRGNHNTN